jgi:hypothetical protein
MRWLTWFLLALLTAAPICAKPKVDVRVKVNEGIGRDRATDSISKNNHPTTDNTMIKETVWFLNVTVVSDNAEAVAKGNGQWCITGIDALDVNGEYNGTLDGNSLEIQMPLKNGKTKKEHFEIFDHKWRKLSGL